MTGGVDGGVGTREVAVVLWPWYVLYRQGRDGSAKKNCLFGPFLIAADEMNAHQKVEGVYINAR